MKKESVLLFYLKYRFYIFPAVVSISSLFLIVFAIYPQTVSLLNNQRVIGELINKSNILETKAEALEIYDEADLTRKVGLAVNVYPVERDFGNILGLLQQLTAASGFSISSFSLGNATNKLGNAESYEVKLEIKGGKMLFPALIKNIENSPRLMKINRIDISSNQAAQTVDVSLVVRALYSGLPQTFGSPDSPLPKLSQKDEEFLAIMAETVSGNYNVGTSSASPLLPRGKENPFE